MNPVFPNGVILRALVQYQNQEIDNDMYCSVDRIPK